MWRHWRSCVLLRKLGGIWFLNGAGDRLLKVILQEVGEEWHTWMKCITDQSSEPLDDFLYQPKGELRSQLFNSASPRVINPSANFSGKVADGVLIGAQENIL